MENKTWVIAGLAGAVVIGLVAYAGSGSRTYSPAPVVEQAAPVEVVPPLPRFSTVNYC
jgi:hypothetical protein